MKLSFQLCFLIKLYGKCEIVHLYVFVLFNRLFYKFTMPWFELLTGFKIFSYKVLMFSFNS